MKITAVIPMYNSKDTIKSAIESVLNQTYKEPIEIIVVNDGSKDRCEEIIEDIIISNQTNRTIKLINKQNSGVSSARNRGIKEASGEYIAFLDSDDTWYPQKLEIIEKKLKKNDINFIAHTYTVQNNIEIIYSKNKIKQIKFFNLLMKNIAQTSCIIIKREICDLFDESMSHTEDHDLWLRTSLVNNMYFIDLPLTILGRPQLSQGGLSSNKWAMRKGELKMYLNITKRKKIIIIFLPLLFSFSLLKHFRNYLKDFFEKTN